jgi:hypothetical protein
LGMAVFFIAVAGEWFCRRVVVLDRFIQENRLVTSGGS